MVSLSTWKQLQAASGLAFGLFLALHFRSHYANIQGLDQGLSALQKVRGVYQRPIVELCLVATVLLHMTSNTILYLNRSKVDSTKKKDGGKEPAGSMELKAHRIAGIILALSIFGHVYATRIASLMTLDDPSLFDYRLIKMTNEYYPANLFAVYLVIFGMAANWHLLFGVRSALATLSGESVIGKPVPIPLKMLALLAHILIIWSVLSILGVFYKVDTEEQVETFETWRKALSMG